MSDMEFRYKTTRFIWGVFFALMMVLIISTSWTDGFSIFHFLIGGAMTLFTFVTTGTVWSWGENNSSSNAISESATHKRKSGDKLNQLLSRLSDEEVDILREKLMDEGAYGVGDDGEIVMKRLK
jgi:hypothetical protein